jgi:hypothetical protein
VGSDRRIAPAALLLALAGHPACERRATPNVAARVAPGVSVRASEPDRLAAGETAPGTESVFDLVLPRGSKVTGRFDRTAYATLPLTVDDAAKWLRHNAESAEAIIGPSGTSFDRVRLAGWPRSRWLRVAIGPTLQPGRSSVTIDEVVEVPLPAPSIALPQDEVMRRAGLTPDGRLLDPGGIGGVAR